MRLSHVVSLCVGVLIVVGSVNACGAQDWSNWIRPGGFQTPNLDAGQYYFGSGIHLSGQSARSRSTFVFLDQETVSRSFRTSNSYSLSMSGLYALTDRLIISSSVSFSPPQSDFDQTYTLESSSGSYNRQQSDLDHMLNVNITFTYKPVSTLELFGRGSYYRQRNEDLSESISLPDWRNNEGFSLSVGFATAR